MSVALATRGMIPDFVSNGDPPPATPVPGGASRDPRPVAPVGRARVVPPDAGEGSGGGGG